MAKNSNNTEWKFGPGRLLEIYPVYVIREAKLQLYSCYMPIIGKYGFRPVQRYKVDKFFQDWRQIYNLTKADFINCVSFIGSKFQWNSI